MALEIEGKVYQILPEQTGTSQNGKNWRKQTLVIETMEQYPKKIAFTVWNDNVDAVKQLKPNDKVKIFFRVESREYQDRWYTDAVAWRITKVMEQDLTPSSTNQINNTPNNDIIYENNTPSNTPQNTDTTYTENDIISDDNEEDDLPF